MSLTTGKSLQRGSRSSAAFAKRSFNPDGGEDEGVAADGGDESGMRDDRKPITGNWTVGPCDVGDDRHNTEELTKAGRDIDPDDGSE